MAKIDTAKIEGYADMTAEEKLAALEGYDIPEPDMKGFVTKAQFDKTASGSPRRCGAPALCTELPLPSEPHITANRRNYAD